MSEIEVGVAAYGDVRGSGWRSELQRASRVMVAARWPVLAVAFLLFAAIAAVFGGWLAPFDPVGYIGWAASPNRATLPSIHVDTGSRSIIAFW